jgi:hypothetical protein
MMDVQQEVDRPVNGGAVVSGNPFVVWPPPVEQRLHLSAHPVGFT